MEATQMALRLYEGLIEYDDHKFEPKCKSYQIICTPIEARFTIKLTALKSTLNETLIECLKTKTEHAQHMHLHHKRINPLIFEPKFICRDVHFPLDWSN